MQNPGAFSHPVADFRLHETHISWVLLTGPYAYKFKKPLDLGFADYSSLEKRRRFCEEELRLNRRLAPDLYLDVVAVTGDVRRPRVGGDGEAIEYCVRMAQFLDGDRLDKVIERGELETAQIDSIAEQIARFHQTVLRADLDSRYGTPEMILERVLANFFELEEVKELGESRRDRLNELETWSRTRHKELEETFRQRRRDGFVRECHGDMHLGNMALWKSRVIIFDAIEFSPFFRWIDVISELAFLSMDLRRHGRPDYAHRVLNAYLEATGDYAALTTFQYYLIYRALVRAKVAGIRLRQAPAEAQTREMLLAECESTIDFTHTLRSPPEPALWITYAPSGSGKTTITQGLLETSGAIRLRADVERKRLHGLEPEARTDGALKRKLYGQNASRRTFAHLRELAKTLLRAGHRVIVDSTFLARKHRFDFRMLADELAVPFVIIDIQLDEQTLRERVQSREHIAKDASEADLDVLKHQLANREDLDLAEQSRTVTIEGGSPPPPEELLRRLDAK